MLKRDDWLELARRVDWDLTYVREEDAFPAAAAGEPWLPSREWQDWDEPYRTTFAEYVTGQSAKDASVYAVRDAVGRVDDWRRVVDEWGPWMSALKLHAATLPLAEFAAVVGNLRAVRFGRASAWRHAALLGALDEMRHAQIPLVVLHELVKVDAQFDWTHRFYHSNDWVAIAGRHLVDELLLTPDPIEFAVATNFVFETGFTNLQFVGLSALARAVGDRLFEKMVASIQSDEARHAQIGGPVLRKLVEHDKKRAQFLVDKWFWRSWLLFAVVTGFAMDYLVPLADRKLSFKEFVEEWVLTQFAASLDGLGLEKPWYWPQFLEALGNFHHMLYASAYSYRATVWFDLVVPSPRERAWLRQKYPHSWGRYEPVWERIVEKWRRADPDNDFAVHGTAIPSFCDLCQLVLCGGTPAKNSAEVVVVDGQKRIFRGPVCRWIFEQEPARYGRHREIVKRVLAGEAPANVVAMLRHYFGLDHDTWGRDLYGGRYPWLRRDTPRPSEKAR